jgi:hypothetical protein
MFEELRREFSSLKSAAPLAEPDAVQAGLRALKTELRLEKLRKDVEMFAHNTKSFNGRI